MTVLASSFSAIRASVALAFEASFSAISMSKTLPWRTAAMPLKPSAASAAAIALPCGSRTPSLRRTVTRVFTMRGLLDQHRADALWAFRLDQDPKPAGDLLIG